MDRDTIDDQQEDRMLPLIASLATHGVLPEARRKKAESEKSPSTEYNPMSSSQSLENTEVPRFNPLNAYQKAENAAIRAKLNRNAAVATDSSGVIDLGRGPMNPLADALSSSLAGFARAAPSPGARLARTNHSSYHQRATGVESTTSSSGEPVTREALTSSDRDSSTANGSGNIVTATQTTSSGDDRDSSGGNATSGGVSSELSGPGSSLVRHHHHHHHHHHHRPRFFIHANDGSALPNPGEDGLNRPAGGPATVVASRLPPPNSDFSSSCSGGEGDAQDSLLEPRREPGFHTIRRTFSRLPRRDARRNPNSSATESSSNELGARTKKFKGKHGLPKTSGDVKAKKKKSSDALKARPQTAACQQRGRSPSPDSDTSNTGESNGGSSSGSGTEGGYAASASSNDISAQQDSSSSPSVSSSEEPRRKSKRHKTQGGKHKSKHGASSEDTASSEIADFSSSYSENDGDESRAYIISTCDAPSPASPSLSFSSNGEGGLEETYLRAKRAMDEEHRFLNSAARKRKAGAGEGLDRFPHAIATTSQVKPAPWPRPRIRIKDSQSKPKARPPILTVGSDIMAHVLTFLQPPEILSVLTSPLSKEWLQNFASQPELWRVLCLVEPFKALIEDEDVESSDSLYSLNGQSDDTRLLNRYRLLYTSFVRCMKYLSQIREDAIGGRPPSYIDYGIKGNGPAALVGTNKSLRSFLARARGVVAKSKRSRDSVSESSDISGQDGLPVLNTLTTTEVTEQPKRKRSGKSKKKHKRPKIGPSMITERILGPSNRGQPGNMALPWSCAIYSIVNWMVAFSDVEGIQTLCMKVLPFLLEDEQQRMTAQRAGLTDVVLRNMVQFPNSAQLHIAAFHTIVLLARPLGGSEGMLFHSSMVASGLFGGDNMQHRRNGIAVMVDSMKRFEDNDILQAMSSWALVNIALAPAQKAVLVKLGGIQATANAMLRHPFSAEVQFRALFALINLVIPSVRMNPENPEAVAIQEQLGEVNDMSEREIIDELVDEITSLVVLAMKNFCSSEAILNRACLVLHNLSLTQQYHSTLLWTPNCYQMLEWCLGNYRTDQVLQQSATGTLHRLQTTLSSDDDLQARFSDSLQSQQQSSLEQAHREAIRLHQHQEELQRRSQR